MPVNFKFPIDESSLSETDLKLLITGNIHNPICVSAPANENGENRTVSLGEFGTAVTNPPVEVNRFIYN